MIDSTCAFLKIIAVEVSSPLETVKTYVLLNDVSTITLINKRIAKQIGVKEKRVRLALRGINGRNAISSYLEKVAFQIAGESEKYQVQNATVVSNLYLPS